MRYTAENDFAKHVKSDEQHRVYLLHGSQPYLIGLYEKLLLNKALGGAENEFNLHRFTAADFDPQRFYDAVESVPLFAEGRCVTFDCEPDRLDAGTLAELTDVLKDPPATTCIILTVKQPPSKKEKLTALLKACDAAGASIELGARGASDVSRFLRDRAGKAGCELSGDVARYLTERTGDDMQLLATELDKVCAYAGTRALTTADVDAVVIPVLQARVFDLSKAILHGDFDRAMQLIDTLCELREPLSMVLAVLAGAFVDLYRGFAARESRVQAGDAAEALGYAKNRVFALKNAMSDSSGCTAAQLGEMLETLATADVRLKSTGASDRVILEQTVTKLFLLLRERAR